MEVAVREGRKAFIIYSPLSFVVFLLLLSANLAMNYRLMGTAYFFTLGIVKGRVVGWSQYL